MLSRRRCRRKHRPQTNRPAYHHVGSVATSDASANKAPFVGTHKYCSPLTPHRAHPAADRDRMNWDGQLDILTYTAIAGQSPYGCRQTLQSRRMQWHTIPQGYRPHKCTAKKGRRWDRFGLRRWPVCGTQAHKYIQGGRPNKRQLVWVAKAKEQRKFDSHRPGTCTERNNSEYGRADVATQPLQPLYTMVRDTNA